MPLTNASDGGCNIINIYDLYSFILLSDSDELLIWFFF